MLLKTAKMLASYKLWANKITFSAVKELPESEVIKERKTNFKNMLSTLNHVYVIDSIFKAHLTGSPHGYTARNTDSYPQLEELYERQKKIDQWYVEYLNSIAHYFKRLTAISTLFGNADWHLDKLAA